MPNPLDDAERRIRELAMDSSKVTLTDHAWEMLAERKRTMTQVLKCLTAGKFIYGPTLNSEKQLGYKFRMGALCAGEWVQVTGKLVDCDDQLILVITVI